MESGNSEEKIDFFLVSTHELRTSMTAMKWMYKMLLAGDFGALNETQTSILTQASTATERMIQLINDTIDIVRTDGPTVEYARSPVSLTQLSEETIKDFTSEAGAKGMHIRYTPSPIEAIVVGDKDKLRIVLHNLLENAIKYGSPDTDITINLVLDDGMAIVSVTNQGVGIPNTEQSRIFEKFFRASNVRDGFVGVGLGLYATKHIIERHGGTLSFASTENGTTTFTMTLPLG